MASNRREFGLYFQSEGHQMTNCQNCGQANSETSNFCRFCGLKMVSNESPTQVFNDPPPRPYMWQTDEHKVSRGSARKTEQIERVQPLPYQNPQMAGANPAMQMTPHRPQMMYGYRCRNCGSTQMPVVSRKVSSAGWIVFAVLLVTFFPLFWVGLLIKEDVGVCPICNTRTV